MGSDKSNIYIENYEKEIRIVYKNCAFANESDTKNAEQSVNMKVVLSKEYIQEAKKDGKSITVVVEDTERADLYTWRFRSKDIQNAEFEPEDLDLSIALLDGISFGVIKANMDEENAGLIVQMNEDQELPFPGSISVYIGKQKGLRPGKSVYVYIANRDKEKLDCIVGGYGYSMSEDGYLPFFLVKFADYALLPNKADEDSVRTLRKQITVKKEIELEVEGKKTIKLRLPKYLVVVEDLEAKTASKAIGGVTVTFTSENKEIATVNSKIGRVKAVAPGETTIVGKITLYSGKTKEVKTKIIVKAKAE